jgi:predicted esterase
MKPGYTVATLCLFVFALSGCRHPVADPPDGSRAIGAPYVVDLIDRPIGKAVDASAYVEGITENEYWVIRGALELEQVKLRLGLPKLFEGESIDFRQEMVVGSIGEPMQRGRTYDIFRVLYTPQAVEVQVVSYERKELDRSFTPYVFVRLPRSEKPVRFYLNSAPATGEDLEPLRPGTHQRTLTHHTHYAVFVPEGLEAPAPMFVFLHSSGSNGNRWVGGLKEYAERYGFVLVLPSSRNGYYWTETYDYPAILEAIEEVKLRYPVDSKRIYAGGSSAGGHTVYHFAIQNRDIFAAFVSAFGRLNPEVEDDLLRKGKGMPALLVCGENDPLVPIEKVIAGKKRLEQFGVDVTFRPYPIGHGGTEWGGDYIFRWLSERAYGTEKPRDER